VLCAEYNAFWQEHRAAVKDYLAAVRDLVALVDHSSATNTQSNLAHLRIKAARGRWEVTQAALTLHELEHGCTNSKLVYQQAHESSN
jgi:hypothetical protein